MSTTDDSMYGATSSDDIGSENDSDHMYEDLRADTQEKEVRKLTRKETQGVRTWKVLTLLTIMITAVGVSTGTYYFIDRQEEHEFERSYELFTKTINDAIEFHVKNVFNSIHNVAEQISKESAIRNESFPYVTVPMFEVMASQYRATSGAESVYWGPVITKEQKEEWVRYSVENFNWLEESRAYGLSESGETFEEAGYDSDPIRAYVYDIDAEANPIHLTDPDGPYEPLWQMSPPPYRSSVINYNLHFTPYVPQIESATDTLRRGLIDAVRDFSLTAGMGQSVADHEAYHNSLVMADRKDGYNSYTHPHALIAEPVFEDILNMDTSNIVGHVLSLMTWDAYLVDLLPEGVEGITAVVRNTCGQTYTYKLNGNMAFYEGEGDFHDPRYDRLEEVIPFHAFTGEDLRVVLETAGHCLYSFHIYPTSVFESTYRSDLPTNMTIVVASVFLFLIGVFFMYDRFVYRRNRKILNAAVKFNGIVSSLFPSNVRDRLFGEAMEEKSETKPKEHDRFGRNRLKRYLGGGESDDEDKAEKGVDEAFYKTKPIADLFTDTTILFADLAGFTAWSSTREPTQVFILLETIYKAFDDIAKTRGVFKVETVGDCYVAVTGLPDPRKDHAVAMARFAVDCMHRMHDLTAKLEVMLGPDTSDLDCRVGMHSGPVTAGVLRGERSRFQLFGDTMNTASRMESNGEPGRIQLSQETADLLIAAGKQHWLTPREDKIVAKGKGELQTFWLTITSSTTSSGRRSEVGSAAGERIGGDTHAHPELSVEVEDVVKKRDAKTERLVQWNVDVLLSLLRKVAAYRGQPQKQSTLKRWEQPVGSTVLDEVQEIISLPGYDAERQTSLADPEQIDLGVHVEQQLKDYVSTVASMYRTNPFHNFEHASHVTMSVVKLMSRIVAPDVEARHSDLESTLHKYTFGITSDPLTQFACVFSALIHDVDHYGIPNTQLIVENPELASVYKSKSVAEQNSVDLSWDLLQDDSFIDLRAAIYNSPAEQKRFRHLVVNSVMATDIMDKDLKSLRNARWEKAFSEQTHEDSPKDIIDRKATIVIEHLIQASDVAHTMQHWHIYRKWNERLFDEMYCAYKEGRSASDPTDTWYRGEIGFFDFYIIPLAKKLKDCGVFGVSSDEYLNYAEKNRAEWEQRGQEVVAKMVERIRKKYSEP